MIWVMLGALLVFLLLQAVVVFGFIRVRDRKKYRSLIFCQLLLIIGYLFVGFVLGWVLF